MPTPPSRKETPRGQPVDRTLLFGKKEFDSLFASWLGKIRQALRSQAGEGKWALVGIKRRGALLARRLWKELSSKEAPLLYGEVDISLYRDDYHLQKAGPQVLGTEIDFGVDGVNILLVDDVLYTGRTVRAAMDLILDFGRPRVISLAVFIDREHRELPIAANFVGKEVATDRQDQVQVELAEMGEEDGVKLIRRRRT
jgi:pyrimidine operon attenuation protein/uracil phosphoribosyltransferase